MRTHISLIAALFLATGTAHAAEGDFNCDQLPKYYLGGSLSTEKTTKDVTFNFNVGFSDNRERSLPGEEIVIRYNMRTSPACQRRLRERSVRDAATIGHGSGPPKKPRR
jgi:hypothetical protein